MDICIDIMSNDRINALDLSFTYKLTRLYIISIHRLLVIYYDEYDYIYIYVYITVIRR